MKTFATASLLIALVLAPAAGAGEVKSFTGSIGDKMCGTKHMMEGDDPKCTLACVDKGSKFVFIQGDKVLDIENQDAKGLREAAGKKVAVKGELSKDGKSLKIAEIRPAK